MTKSKHIAKKKVVKHKTIKRSKNNNNSNTAAKHSPVPMSRLEYEQSLMDPRFRAAMQGFNNPANNINQLANHQMHEQETRNNELTRQLSFQNDLAQAKQTNLRLQNELSTTKLQHQNENALQQLALANQKHTYEMETIRNKHEFTQKISKLNTDLANQKKTYEEEQQR